jgi:thiamine biosynthesis lipoprotein
LARQHPTRGVDVEIGEDCWRGKFAAMASPCEVLCEVTERAEAERLTWLVASEAWRIEDKFSRYLPDNSVDRINSSDGKPIELDPETADLIAFCATLYDLSGGRFDITSGVLRRVWTFDGGDELPAAAEISRILGQMGWQHVSWDPPVLQMPAGMQIDLGGVGKEYAVDCAVELLRSETPHSCLVNFGGDLATTGQPQRRKGWIVGIEALEAGVRAADKTLSLQVGALATSGDARRFILKDGVRYGHILDPKTGWPVPDAPRSVTVAADTCTQAGMLSTFAMLEGNAAEAFLDAQRIRYWCNRTA